MLIKKIENSMSRLTAGLFLLLTPPSLAETQALTSLAREAQLSQFFQDSVQPMLNEAIEGHFPALQNDGQSISLRFQVLLPPRARAGVVIVHGFGERLDKYQEIAYDFYQQGYNVYLYDQRGQGGSSRLQNKNQAVHVENFLDYVGDLRLFLSEVVRPHQGEKELFVFAHSMGGAITSRFLVEHPGFFKAAILSAPMHQMLFGGYPPWVAKSLSVIADTLGFGGSYALGQSEPKPWPFEHAATQSRPRWEYY